jgi:hypothetical protein
MFKCEPAGATVLATTGEGAPALTSYNLGKGTVFFLADPIECQVADDPAPLRNLYAWFLGKAGIRGLEVEPNDPTLHVFAQPIRAGVVHVAFNCRKGNSQQDVTLPTRAGRITLRVRDGYGALAAVRDAGEVVAIEGHGAAAIAGGEFISGDATVCVAALDGKDVRKSEALLVLPFTVGKTTLVRPVGWKGMEIVLGDVQDGGFVPLERPAAGPADRLTLAFDEDRATLIGLVCPKGCVAAWAGRIVDPVSE